jgi:Holliday junction resolvase RusA-like endonuclease
MRVLSFFHAAGIERYRINTITSMDTQEGQTLNDHVEKTAHIWEVFKHRLSSITHTQMHFDLQQMISQHNLEKIETPFTNKDIDNIVKSMPPDKALGPNGFNGVFIKKILRYH